MGEDGRVEDVSRSERFVVVGASAKGGERTSVDDSLHLNDESIKDVHVERKAGRLGSEMAFE